MALAVPSLRMHQAATEGEFAQGLTIMEPPAVGLLDWSVTFGDGLALLRRGQERWPAMPWIVFCRTDPAEVRASLAGAGLPGETPAVVTDFAALVEAAGSLLAKLAAPSAGDCRAWQEKWQAVPFGVALVDRRRRLIRHANPVLGRWLGAEPADCAGTPLDQLHPPEQVRRLEAWLHAPGRADAPAPPIEVSFTRGGQIRFADALIAPPEPGRPDWRTIFYVEASERRAMERKWRHLAEIISQTGGGEAFFRTLVQGLCGVLEVDMAAVALLLPGEPARARIVAMCDRSALVEGFEITMAGNPCAEVIKHQFLCVTRRVARSFPAAEWLLSRDVESYLGLPLFDQAGRPIGILEVMHRQPLRKTRDLRAVMQVFAARAALELERQDREKMFRDLFAHAPDATLLVDRRGAIVMANEVALRMFGYTAGEMLGLSVEKLMPDSARTGHVAMREKFHRETAPREMGSGRPNLRGLRKDGTTFAVDIGLSPLATPAGPGVIAAIRDMTEQRLTEARLRQSQKMKSLGLLAGGIAHDFNNILSGILGFAELTLMDLPTGHPLRDNLVRIQQAGLRARSLVAQILAISRPATPAFAPVHPAQVAREVLDFLRPALPVTSEITLTVSPSCPAILADPAQFHQVLMNLCTNAWQALPDGCGHIAVELASVEVDAGFAAAHPGLQPGHHVRLTVADTGAGMDAATLEHVFDPFFTTKATGKGTGLGLAVVHGIVKEHHGAIAVRSVIGTGTAFDVYFPAHVGPAPLTRPEAPPVAAGRGQRILLVDDDEITGPTLEKIIHRLGYCPVHHRQPLAALAELERDQRAFDLVLTDMTMPEMTGVTLAEAVRKLRPDLPVLLVTGLATPQTRETAMQAGVREVLLKPVTMDQLGAAIHRSLGQSRRS